MKYLSLIAIALIFLSACTVVNDTPERLNPNSNNFNPDDSRNFTPQDLPERPFNNTNMTKTPKEEILESTKYAFASGDVESYCLDNFKQCIAYCMENKENTNCETIMRKQR